MANLKVLPLETWMKFKHRARESALKSYEETAPVFNRPGCYMQDGRAWFELEDGRAFTDSGFVISMQYRLELDRAASWSKEEADAIFTLAHSKTFSTPELREWNNLRRESNLLLGQSASLRKRIFRTKKRVSRLKKEQETVIS